MEQSLHIHPQIRQREETPPPGLTRRQSIQWLGVLTASLSAPLISGCDAMMISGAKLAGRWPDLQLEPITGEGYGTDPNLVSPPQRPWPLTMTPAQRELTTILVDILIPREGDKPAASDVHVPELLDEWVSAPYPSFQSDRVEILSALVWFDEEADRRFGVGFVQAAPAQRLAIIDDIAFEKAESELRYAYISRVFNAVRTLVVIAYFASPEGSKEIGYQGNIAIAGDYPGPSEEAKIHLERALADLGLSEYAEL